MVGPKKYHFWQKINNPPRKPFFKFLQGMLVRQKLGLILESKVVQKLSLEKDTKKWYPKFIFLNDFFFENIWLIFDTKN